MNLSPWLERTDSCGLMNSTANGMAGFVLTSMMLLEVPEWTFLNKYALEYTWVEFFAGFQ